MITRTSIALFIICLILLLFLSIMYYRNNKLNNENQVLNEKISSLIKEKEELFQKMQENSDITDNVIKTLQNNLKLAEESQNNVIKQYEEQIELILKSKEVIVNIEGISNKEDNTPLGIDVDSSKELLDVFNKLFKK